jgi:hypothetical protein
LQRWTGGLVLDCLASFANKLIYRWHVLSSFNFDRLLMLAVWFVHALRKAQKGVTCLFPESRRIGIRQSAQASCPEKIGVRDVLTSR